MRHLALRTGRSHVRRAAIAAALCTAAAVPAAGMVLIPADLPTIVKEASVIVHGRVVDVRGVVIGPGAIESLVTVAVMESVKGASASSLTFRVPGGQVGRYRRVLVGAPAFAGGEEIVVFLRGRPPAVPTLVGLSHGVYRVGRDASARPIMVAEPGGGAAIRGAGPRARQPMPVEVFVRTVQRLALEER